MLENGYIKLYRSLTSWEWYTDKNVKVLFLHLLLTVNYEPSKWKGQEIKRGQRITSYNKLSIETGLSIKEIRTALAKLKRTHDVAVETSSKHSIISVLNYDKYQEEAGSEANKGQAKGKRGAGKGQQRKKANKAKEEKEIIKSYKFSNVIEEIINDWLEYKIERRERYGEKGLKSFLTQVKNKLKNFTEDEIIASFNNSMANGWKGWNFDLKSKEDSQKSTISSDENYENYQDIESIITG